jgi:hypothetical protein
MNKELKILLNKYGKRAVSRLKAQVKIDNTNATGATLNSIGYSIKGNTIQINHDAALNIVDEGLKAEESFPNVGNIILWMKRKNIQPRKSVGSRGSQFTRRVAGSQGDRNYRASAFAIAKAIHEKGTIKRFGYKGSNVLDVIGKGSSFEKDLIKDLLSVVDKEIKIIFNKDESSIFGKL